ncbi:putative phenylacetyl-CoA ligase [Aspergillus taichungensis]|uniref:Putative phenylacetyl-CoA ligase n=1 Tax=Aspergillus taichungensis TaxID=482145 RepID=A0A2J5HE90_9EURO|nr:putative phenylacetyl-CoA ligase [Aspergillus taichungensis]
MAPTIPSIDLWELLFERQDRSFPDNHEIFKSSKSKSHYTFKDVRDRAQVFGQALKTHWGWKKGDVLLVMAPNVIETPSVIWGCHWAGGVVAPTNPGLSAEELQYNLGTSNAKGLVLHPQCVEVGLEAARKSNLPAERILVLGDDQQGLVTVDSFVRNSNSRLTRTPVDPENDLAYLVYSSGTTGKPKAVMITHRNVVAEVVLAGAAEGHHVDWTRDRILAVLPTYHIYGLICLVHLPIWLGTPTIMMEKFELEAFCRLIETENITHVYVAPPIVLHLAKNSTVSRFNLSSLRMITSGGAPLAAALIREGYQRLRIPIRQAYGLSETVSISHRQSWDTWDQAIGSSGPVLSGLEAKMMIDDARQARNGEEGELWIRGPNVFKGYLNNAEQTDACLTADGWFKTGDIGYEDTNGNLYLTDRAKDMIKYKGYQIAPTELEDILLGHPHVKDAAVIGVANEDLQTEVPLAYLVLQDAAHETEAMAVSILSSLKDRVAHYKHLRGGIVWIPQVPKSAAGKVLKRELKDRVKTVDRERILGAVTYTLYRQAKL